jgi:hypothetical protein
MKREINNFVFSGILAKHSVKDMEATGLLRGRAVTEDERREQDLFAPVQEHIRAGAVQMQKHYRILYVLENIVRDLIVTRFTEAAGSADWFDARASADMKKKLEQRQKAEEKNEWHTGRNRQPIYYMDFGDLARLIVNHWSVFEDLLPNQVWVQSRLDEAERTRNVIAHTNVLAAEEGARLEMYLRDWIRQIG